MDFAIVIAMYTNSGARGARHEHTEAIHSVGAPSYVNVLIYRHSHLNTYMSLACSELECNTFLRVPRTHVLFSFATPSATQDRQDFLADSSHPLAYITLSPFAATIFKTLCDRKTDVAAAVSLLVALEKQNSEGSLLIVADISHDVPTHESDIQGYRATDNEELIELEE